MSLNHSYGEYAILITKIVNTNKYEPLTIMSGEFTEINKKVLMPGQGIKLKLEIPFGFREFFKEKHILGKTILYIGLQDADAAEPLIHKANI